MCISVYKMYLCVYSLFLSLFSLLFGIGEMFAKLQRAKEVLTDPDMRMKYDGWRRSGLLVPFDLWLSRQMSPVSQALFVKLLCLEL